MPTRARGAAALVTRAAPALVRQPPPPAPGCWRRHGLPRLVRRPPPARGATGDTGSTAGAAAGAASAASAASAAPAASAASACPLRRASTPPTGTTSPSWATSSSIVPSSKHSTSTADFGGLDHRDDVAAVHRVAGRHQPLDEDAPPPCRRRGRASGTHPSPPTALRRGVGDVRRLRERRLLEVGGVRQGDLGRADPLERRVELVERLLGEPRDDLGREAAGPPALVDDDGAVGPATEARSVASSSGPQDSQVDDLGRDALCRKQIRRGERLAQTPPP